MPAIVAIPALIGAGTSIAGGIAQSRAAGKAERAQTRAADQAIGAQNDAYRTQQGLYQGMLGSASNTLGRLLTPGAGATYAAPGAQSRPFVGVPGMGQPDMPPQALARPSGFSRALSSGDMAALATGTTNARRPFATGQPDVSGGMVQLRAPDGSVRPVPSNLVDKYLQRGAQRVF